MQEISKTESIRSRNNYPSHYSFAIVQEESLILLLLKQCNPMCNTKKLKKQRCWLAFGVSLEMQPWVCVNPQTAEEELEPKPKRP